MSRNTTPMRAKYSGNGPRDHGQMQNNQANRALRQARQVGASMSNACAPALRSSSKQGNATFRERAKKKTQHTGTWRGRWSQQS